MSEAVLHRTLVVDDVAAVRNLVRLALEESGRFQVAGEAADGREAVAQAQRVRPDLILLDLAMPGMDGLQALPLLREATPQARIVIHSSSDHNRDAREALDHGAHAHVQKGLPGPVFVARLLDVLAAPANGRRPIAEPRETRDDQD